MNIAGQRLNVTALLIGGQNVQKELIKYIDNGFCYVIYPCLGNRR